jgi:adenosylmethionine-8-amino-7-oxononanoate aminotransferase
VSRVLHRSGAIPPIAVSGEGIYLHTADGRSIIDASGGAAVAAIGHGNRRVVEAIARQAATMAYAHTGTFSNQPAEDLADILLDGEPGGLTRAWFCSFWRSANPDAFARSLGGSRITAPLWARWRLAET